MGLTSLVEIKSEGLAGQTFLFQWIPPRYTEYFSVTKLQRGNYSHSRANSHLIFKYVWIPTSVKSRLVHTSIANGKTRHRDDVFLTMSLKSKDRYSWKFGLWLSKKHWAPHCKKTRWTWEEGVCDREEILKKHPDCHDSLSSKVLLLIRQIFPFQKAQHTSTHTHSSPPTLLPLEWLCFSFKDSRK